jgi:hypothetical protein
LVEKHELKRPLGRPRHRWEDNIKSFWPIKFSSLLQNTASAFPTFCGLQFFFTSIYNNATLLPYNTYSDKYSQMLLGG